MPDLLHKDTVGPVKLYLDKSSRDLVLAVATELGKLAIDLTPEQACQLGISLIRRSGERHVFEIKDPHVKQPVNTDPAPELSGPGRDIGFTPILDFPGCQGSSNGQSGRQTSYQEASQEGRGSGTKDG